MDAPSNLRANDWDRSGRQAPQTPLKELGSTKRKQIQHYGTLKQTPTSGSAATHANAKQRKAKMANLSQTMRFEHSFNSTASIPPKTPISLSSTSSFQTPFQVPKSTPHKTRTEDVLNSSMMAPSSVSRHSSTTKTPRSSYQVIDKGFTSYSSTPLSNNNSNSSFNSFNNSSSNSSNRNNLNFLFSNSSSSHNNNNNNSHSYNTLNTSVVINPSSLSSSSSITTSNSNNNSSFFYSHTNNNTMNNNNNNNNISIVSSINSNSNNSNATSKGDTIKVFIRVRPAKANEEIKIASTSEPTIAITANEVRCKNKNTAYDQVFGPQASQEDVFKVIGPLVSDNVSKGYNACVLAYGQTGTGKTFTMLGYDTDQLAASSCCSSSDSSSSLLSSPSPSPSFSSLAGLIPRLVAHLFERLKNKTIVHSAPSSSSSSSSSSFSSSSSSSSSSMLVDSSQVSNLLEEPQKKEKEREKEKEKEKDSRDNEILSSSSSATSTTTSTTPISTVEVTYSFSCSMIEIYNEVILDMLVSSSSFSSSSSSSSLSSSSASSLRPYTSQNGTIYIPGLIQKPVSNLSDVLHLLEVGMSTRRTRSTAMNEESSRSHVIFSLHIERITTTATTTLTSNSNNSNSVSEPQTETVSQVLRLVDLAGSECAQTAKTSGDSQKEASNINKSLSTLTSVIENLTKAKPLQVIPYRDSKLTSVLKDSLGGNAVTAIIATISPAASSQQETMSTLFFAERAKKVKQAPTITRSTQMGTFTKEQVQKLLQEEKTRWEHQHELDLKRKDDESKVAVEELKRKWDSECSSLRSQIDDRNVTVLGMFQHQLRSEYSLYNLLSIIPKSLSQISNQSQQQNSSDIEKQAILNTVERFKSMVRLCLSQANESFDKSKQDTLKQFASPSFNQLQSLLQEASSCTTHEQKLQLLATMRTAPMMSLSSTCSVTDTFLRDNPLTLYRGLTRLSSSSSSLSSSSSSSSSSSASNSVSSSSSSSSSSASVSVSSSSSFSHVSSPAISTSKFVSSPSSAFVSRPNLASPSKKRLAKTLDDACSEKRLRLQNSKSNAENVSMDNVLKTPPASSFPGVDFSLSPL